MLLAGAQMQVLKKGADSILLEAAPVLMSHCHFIQLDVIRKSASFGIHIHVVVFLRP